MKKNERKKELEIEEKDRRLVVKMASGRGAQRYRSTEAHFIIKYTKQQQKETIIIIEHQNTLQ